MEVTTTKLFTAVTQLPLLGDNALRFSRIMTHTTKAVAALRRHVKRTGEMPAPVDVRYPIMERWGKDMLRELRVTAECIGAKPVTESAVMFV